MLTYIIYFTLYLMSQHAHRKIQIKIELTCFDTYLDFYLQVIFQVSGLFPPYLALILNRNNKKSFISNVRLNETSVEKEDDAMQTNGKCKS